MILVFGSLNGDFFLHVKNFPMPGETVLTPGYRVKPGGKGANQAAAAAKAGAEVVFIGAVGKDEVAEIPVSALKAAGVDCSRMQMSEVPTGMAVIMVDASGENSIVVASGANGKLSAGSVPEDLLGKGCTLVLQMEVPPAESFSLLHRAKAKGAVTILNAAPAHPVPADVLPLIDYLIVNEIEAAMIWGGLYETEMPADAGDAARGLAEKTGGTCIMTLGSKGAAAARNGEVFRACGLHIRPVDTTGAGDAFAGIFAAMTDRGLPLEKALRYASAGAGLACLKAGAQEGQPYLKEIEERLEGIHIT